MQENRERVLYFDVLNILSCIAVIALHHNGLVHSFEPTLAWKESLVVECGFYWAVPVFLMLSGANLLDYRAKYSTGVFIKKRLGRTLLPWLFWSVVMLLWKTATGQLTLESTGIGYLLNLILNYKVENVYWFFGALFACYLAIPVFSLIVKDRNMLWYIVLLNFVLLSCLPVIKTWFGFSWSLDVPVAGSLIIYVLLGYLLSTETISRQKRRILYLLGAGGFLLRYIYTYILSMRSGKTDTSIKGYVIFHAVFLSAAVFVWARHVEWKKYLPGWLVRRLPTLSSCSFGIFLIHKIVMYYERTGLDMSVKRHVWRIGMIPVTYLISLGIVLLIKRIPRVGKMLL